MLVRFPSIGRRCIPSFVYQYFRITHSNFVSCAMKCVDYILSGSCSHRCKMYKHKDLYGRGIRFMKVIGDSLTLLLPFVHFKYCHP